MEDMSLLSKRLEHDLELLRYRIIREVDELKEAHYFGVQAFNPKKISRHLYQEVLSIYPTMTNGLYEIQSENLHNFGFTHRGYCQIKLVDNGMLSGEIIYTISPPNTNDQLKMFKEYTMALAYIERTTSEFREQMLKALNEKIFPRLNKKKYSNS